MRIRQFKPKYVNADLFDKLRKRMKIENVTFQDLGNELNVSGEAVRHKFKVCAMTTQDLIVIAHKLNLTKEEIGELLIYEH